MTNSRKTLSSGRRAPAGMLLLLSFVAASAQQPTLPLLSPGTHELRGGQTNSYRLLLKAGEFLHATVDQNGIDVVVAIFGPDGKQLSESDSPNDRWGTEPIVLVATVSGEYRVDIRAGSPKASAATYTIAIIA